MRLWRRMLRRVRDQTLDILEALEVAEDYDKFFSEHIDLTIDNAVRLIDGTGKYGVGSVFKYLSSFRAEDHRQIAERISQFFIETREEDRHSYLSSYVRSDSEYETAPGNPYEQISDFLIAYGFLPQLVQAHFEFAEVTREIVAEYTKQGQFVSVLKNFELLEPVQLLPLARQMHEANEYSTLMRKLVELPVETLDTFSVDDLFEVYCLQNHSMSYFENARIEKYIINNFSKMTRYSSDDVAIGLLKASDGATIERILSIPIREPERLVAAIENHPNVTGLVRTLERPFNGKKLSVELPDYLRLAYHLLPTDTWLDIDIISAVKQATQDQDISNIDFSSFDRDVALQLLGEDVLDDIAQQVASQYAYRHFHMGELFRGTPLEPPLLGIELKTKYPFLSDMSIAQLLTLDRDREEPIRGLQNMGITNVGTDGYEQVPELLLEIHSQLQPGNEFTFDISQRDAHSIVIDTVMYLLDEVTLGHSYLESIETGRDDVAPPIVDGQYDHPDAFKFPSRGFESADDIKSYVDQAIAKVLHKCIEENPEAIFPLLERLSSSLHLPILPSGVYIPREFGDIEEYFGLLDRDVMRHVFDLKFAGNSYGFYPLTTYGEEFTYDDLVGVVRSLTRQLENNELLTYPLEDELVHQMVELPIDNLFDRYVSIQMQLVSMEEDTPERSRVRTQLNEVFQRLDAHLGSLARTELNRDKNPVTFLQQFPNIESRLKATGIIGVGEVYIPKVLSPISEHFKGYPEEIVRDIYDLVYFDQLPDSLREIGVTQTGERGYAQAVEKIDAMKRSILEGKVDPDYKDTLLYQGLFAHTVRLRTTQFGAGRVGQAQRILSVENVDLDLASATIEPLSRIPSSVKTNDEIRRVFNAISSDFRAARNIVGEDGTVSVEGLQALFERIESLAQERIAKLHIQKSHADPANVKRHQKLDSEIEALGMITAENLWDLSRFYENIERLTSYKEFKRPLRELLFVTAISKNPGIDERTFTELDAKASLGISRATAMVDFVHHVAFNETWKQAFEEHSSERTLQHYLESDDLEHFVYAIEKRAQSSAQRVPFELVPVRGPLLEASGSIADTCWNGRYGSITDEFPNIRAVLIVKNSNTPLQSRMAGAGLLIGGKAKDGTPLLIIRGLNPLESDITQLMSESFFLEFARYADSIAKSEGRQLAVVLDGASQASTNRPTLAHYLETLKSKLAIVELSEEIDTTFNGYSLESKTYIVDLEKLIEESPIDISEHPVSALEHCERLPLREGGNAPFSDIPLAPPSVGSGHSL